jgi:hypothetical protein
MATRPRHGRQAAQQGQQAGRGHARLRHPGRYGTIPKTPPDRWGTVALILRKRRFAPRILRVAPIRCGRPTTDDGRHQPLDRRRRPCHSDRALLGYASHPAASGRPATRPQPRRVRVRVSAPLPEIAIQRPGRLHPERNRTMPRAAAPARLADHVHDTVPQVDVGDLEAGQLRQPEPTVQEQHDDGGIPAGGEVGSGAGGEQCAQLLVRQHRCLWITRCRRPDTAVASRSVSPSLCSQRQKCRTPANHPRAVLLDRLSRRSTSQPRMCWRSSSTGPTSGWCSAHGALRFNRSAPPPTRPRCSAGPRAAERW